jgi:hypothetical protein
MTQQDVPSEVKEYARSYMEDYEYADRLRIYCKGDTESESEYNDIHRMGCCGFVDHVRFPFLIGGKEYYFGFNYGH